MANVMFKKGLLASLPATYAAGTFYVTTDERAMYLDVDDSTRIRLGDFQEFETIEALRANVNPSTSALYYVTGANCLAKWNGTDYIQINLDTGMTSVEVTGDGNAVTGATYNATTRKLTLTMGATYETVANVDAKIDAKAGELVHNEVTYETIAEYVNAKTAGIATDAALGDLQNRVLAAEGEIDALQDKVGEKTVSDHIDEKINALDLANTYEAKGAAASALDEAKAYADGKDAAIKAAKDAADAAQADVDELGGKVGEVPADKTIVQMIADAQSAATYDDSALVERVGVVEGKADQLIGEDAGKSVREIANEELAKQLIPEGAQEALDTLEEIAKWIQDHPGDAAAMNAAIEALQAKVDTGDKTVSAFVTDAIAALSIGDYAKAADLTALAARVDALEAKAHEHSNKAELDKIVEGDKAKWDEAVSKAHVHANAEELDKIVEGDVAKWNAAQANAEATAASALAAAQGTLQAAIDQKANSADVYAKTETYTQTEVNAAVQGAKDYADEQIAAATLVWGSF